MAAQLSPAIKKFRQRVPGRIDKSALIHLIEQLAHRMAPEFQRHRQLAGLLIAGLILRGPLAYGFWLAAALSAIAIVVGHLGLPSERRPHGVRLPPLAWRQLMGRFHNGPSVGGLLHHSHHLRGEALSNLPKAARGAFGRFLLTRAAINFGGAPFFL